MGCCCCTQIRSKTIKYNHIKETLNTGDIILFSSGGLSAYEVRCATCSQFSHIGMIVRCKHLNKSSDNLYIWHSPAEALQFMPDVTSGKIKDGPQLNRLRPIIRAAGGVVYIRKLYKPKQKRKRNLNRNYNLFHDGNDNDNDDDGYQLGDACSNGLMDFIKKERSKSYEKSTKQLLLSTYDGPFGQNEEDISSYFCSELVAETFKLLGILKRDIISSEYVPKDFASTSTQELRLQQGYLLTREYKVIIN